MKDYKKNKFNSQDKIFDINDIFVLPQTSIKDVLAIIDSGRKQIALVIDNKQKLIGTINDGDIRRAFIKGANLDDTIENIYSKSPIVAKINDPKDKIINIAITNHIHQIPLVDQEGKVVGLDILDILLGRKTQSNQVVLMVGGLGKRLRPLTKNIPKPMLKVGNKPILETIINKFSEYGFKNFILCVNYKSHIIQNYFADGRSFGVNIEYILEETEMGTAGALSLLKIQNEPFFVMNGDLLTTVNLQHLYDYHLSNNAVATMCVKEYEVQVPYGVISTNDHQITSIEEKPIHKFNVNAGIYMFSPEVVNFIPKNTFFDMTSLFEKLIKYNKKTISFPLREYWLDVGECIAFERANNEFNAVFNTWE